MSAVLIWSETGKDKDGFPVETMHEIPVYAEEKSVTRDEFYKSMQAGVSVKIILEVRIEDFELSRHIENERTAYARKLRYNDEIYDIIRTYKPGKSKMEIVCV